MGIIIISDAFFDFDISKYSLYISDEHGYELNVNTNLSEKFSDIIKDETRFNESMEVALTVFKDDKSEIGRENYEFLLKNQGKSKELFLNAEYIQFNFSDEEVANYIRKNKIDKKIILIKELDYNREEIDKIKILFNGYLDKLYFNLSGNRDLVSFNDYVKTIETIDKLAKYIESFGFSPIEKIMFTYDIVRNKVYKKSNNKDSYASHDLSSALLTDNIVCDGYSHIFKALLDKMNIRNRIAIYSPVNKDESVAGHARSEIYVKDDKYGIDGVYFFDATWDSKKNESSYEHVDSYKYFAKTKAEMDAIDKKEMPEAMVDVSFPYIDEEIDIKIKEMFLNKGFGYIPKEMFKSINHMSYMINDDALIDPIVMIPAYSRYGKIDINEVSRETKKVLKKFTSTISAQTYLRILFNVRKVEYYLDPVHYPFDLEALFKTSVYSKWKYELDPASKLLLLLFEKEIKKIDLFNRYRKESNIDKDILDIRLTKTLRTILEQKK